METILCKNCDTSFTGRYCPNCTQSVEANSRLSFKQVVLDFFDTIFNLDKGFFYTIWNLLKRPGFVAQSFIDGKRKRFTNPVKYFIISTAAQALTLYFFAPEEQNIPSMHFPFLSIEMNENIHLWNQLLSLNYPILIGLINLVFWAVLLYFLFRKLKYNLTELLAILMYFYGTVFLILYMISMIYTPLSQKNVPIELVSFLGAGYMIYAFLNFYKKGSISWRIPRIILVLLALFVFRFFILLFPFAWFFPIN